MNENERKVDEERAIKLVNDDEPPTNQPTPTARTSIVCVCMFILVSFEFSSQQEDVTLRSQVGAAWVCVCVSAAVYLCA